MNAPTQHTASPWVVVDQLCAKADAAETLAALQFGIANDTFTLLPYRSALVFQETSLGGVQFVCASGLSTIDRKTPYGSWLEKVVAQLRPALAEKSRFSKADIPSELAEVWSEYWPDEVAIYRLSCRSGEPLGVVVYLMAVSWPSLADAILAVLHRHQGACWEHLLRRQRRLAFWHKAPNAHHKRGLRWAMAALAVSVAALFLPVRQFVISPAEIVSLDKIAVTAPVEGIVAELVAKPNQVVRQGDILVRLDDTTVRNRLSSAEQALEVARAEYLAGAHRAFENGARSTEVGVLKGRISERAAEVTFLQDQLALLDIRAARDGVAVYGQEDDLIGQPVAPGRKLMELANPDRVGVNVWVPVADAINLEAGATFNMLLYAAPLNPLPAVIEQSSYMATKSPDGVMAYRVRATLASADIPRLGLRGNAKLNGARVPLGYFLLRRPLLVVRQWMGI